MIYFELTALGYKLYLKSWNQRTINDDRQNNRFSSLDHKYLDAFIDFKYQALHDFIPCSDLNVVPSFCQLYQTLTVPDNGVDFTNEIHFDSMIEQ
jgi:hypothetical protein